MELIEKALQEGRKMLTEYESKKVLAHYGIPTAGEALVVSREELATAAARIGFPLVLKGSSANLAHKTEKGLIQTDIRDLAEAGEVFDRIMAGLEGPDQAVLVQEMVKGKRELVVGMIRDPQFGPAVMFGLGGIFTEILRDVSFRVAPLEKRDALEMMNEIKGRKILDAVRGMEAADRDILADILVQVGRIGLENERVKEIDINPIILAGAKGVAVDALIVLE
ncbi:MAG: acetate--CoA ligase family protein [Pseudomonadota bacterium]